jgi:hypothetical protein
MALRSLLLLGGAVALAHAGSSMPVSSSSSSSSSAALGPTRCPLERPVPVDVDIPPGSRLASPPRCAIDRKPSVGWPGYTRPHGSKKTSDAVGMPATALSPTRVRAMIGFNETPPSRAPPSPAGSFSPARSEIVGKRSTSSAR